MDIHKGNRHTITTDGVIATKTDGQTSRSMKYYPERDISAIAGEIDEITAWSIFRDIAMQAESAATPISPDHVLIDGERFLLAEWSASHDERFTAPEGYSPAWALAATVFYTFLGVHVFQALGGKGQSCTAPIPTLRKDLPDLSQLIVRCLDFNPKNRPELSEITSISDKNIIRCKSHRNDFPPKKNNEFNIFTVDKIDYYWPEEMC